MNLQKYLNLKVFILFLTVVLFNNMSVFGQTDGQISGSVKDSAGGQIAGAKVTIINEATNVERDVSTNENGDYVVTNLKPGN